MSELVLILIGAAIGAALSVGLGLLLGRALRTVPSGSAMIVTSISGKSRVVFERALVLPVLHSAELLDISIKSIVVEHGPDDSLRCRDDIRATLRARFMIRVNANADDVKMVRRTISAASLASPEFLHQLFAERFSSGVAAAVALFDFEDLLRNPEEIRQHIFGIIGSDLNGIVLDDLALTAIAMVPVDQYDERDPLDARALSRITERASEHQVRIAEVQRRMRQELAKFEVEEREVLAVLARHASEIDARHERETGSKPDIDELRARVESYLESIERVLERR